MPKGTPFGMGYLFHVNVAYVHIFGCFAEQNIQLKNFIEKSVENRLTGMVYRDRLYKVPKGVPFGTNSWHNPLIPSFYRPMYNMPKKTRGGCIATDICLY